MVVLVGGALTAGYLLRSDECTGEPVVLSVVTSPDQQDVVRELAYAWEAGEHRIDGKCGAILVRGQESSAVGQSLTPTQNGAAPANRVDVWMPDSSTWITSTAARPGVAPLFAYDRPSIATSPIVLALPRPMADALGWPNTPVSWTQLGLQRINGRTWSDYGHPEWGALRIGVGDPRQSTTALGTLLSVVDANGDNKVGETELHNALLLARAATVDQPTSAAFLARLRGATDEAALLAEAGPFPATEQQVAAYDNGDPVVPLTAVHPTEGTIFADYPYVTLAAPWVDPIRQKIAASFLDLIQSDEGREAYGRAGFRDPERTTRYARGLQPVLGMGGPVSDGARGLPTDDGITRTVVFWTALQRRANVLATIDTSGSMTDRAPDGSGTRMQVVQEACIRAITLFSPESGVGLWKFATELDGDKDYRQLVPLGPIGGALSDGTPRRAALETAIRRDLTPKGATGLYDTMYAAFRNVQAHWQPGRLNLLVLMTDGKNEDDGLTRAQLVQRLRQIAQPDKPVQVIAIGFGSDADLAELNAITQAVGGKAYRANSGRDIDRIFLQTLVGGE
ncbi:substrate-binding domain-containing protein [Cryptosporangium aurantiacum]|uniref:Ca-activated chloride channel family protein n=1 Tax=Cryptosporangium aurantiacum TaxID=134849 RepID=A0A1M7JM44_9ACTN|nr:substrate-binding domain-containing protein [Cryptosporangium aurantiacum]SHM54189.1 Ca-activated chloride channel family protein [Cryptosporangium aurantiacum]